MSVKSSSLFLFVLLLALVVNLFGQLMCCRWKDYGKHTQPTEPMLLKHNASATGWCFTLALSARNAHDDGKVSGQVIVLSNPLFFLPERSSHLPQHHQAQV